jgi:hypothetical protein
MIGRMGSWLWWLTGFLCALVFGARAHGGELPEPPPPPYGINTRPVRPVQPVTEEQKQKAEKLIDEYLAAEVNPPAPSAEDQAKIDGFIKDLSSKEFATREATSAGLVKIGRPALAALRKAAESKDPEVAWRAKAAIEKIGDGPQVEGLRSLGWPAQTAVRERADKEKKAMTSAAGAAGEAEGAGKKEEAEKLRAEAKAAQARAEALNKLAAKVTPKPEIILTHPCEMAPMPRPAPPDPPPPPPNPPLK